ncbi:uncharacterized protein LOC134738148 isoform X2 [Pongo pygmaeus]|uniref:uncharacterized protein LOC134738148 isoform X2 n=1 Tax=Pongo pygmaeus TaxID=9600 RepID=UPI00300CE326
MPRTSKVCSFEPKSPMEKHQETKTKTKSDKNSKCYPSDGYLDLPENHGILEMEGTSEIFWFSLFWFSLHLERRQHKQRLSMNAWCVVKTQ